MSFSRRKMLLGTGGATALAVAGPGIAWANERHADAGVVVRWNQALLAIVRTPGAQPATVHATRSFAIMHAAIHNAVVASTDSGVPYLFRVNAERHADPVAAAAQAAHDVLTALYPNQAAELDRRLAADLATVGDPRARAAGARAGALTARLLVAVRTGDGSAASPTPVPPGSAPGQYRPTPPNNAPAVFTHWAAVTPFVLSRGDQFRPHPYPELTTERYAAATNEVQLLGQDTSAARTADQTVQARFWAAPIWNYWNEIAQSVAGARGGGLPAAAGLFARLNLAFADAAIAFYDGKYAFRVWRPITAVRLADTDANPATTANPSWNSLASTPADPAYPGAHSVVAQAGAAILREAFGPARHVTVTSEALAGVERRFTRFSDIADEAGLSRIVAGVHTRLDHDAGQRLGSDVARVVLDTL